MLNTINNIVDIIYIEAGKVITSISETVINYKMTGLIKKYFQ